MKQMRKKAHLEEKHLLLGGFCPKNMVKEQFFCALCGLKILILLNLAQKAYYNTLSVSQGTVGKAISLRTLSDSGVKQVEYKALKVDFKVDTKMAYRGHYR